MIPPAEMAAMRGRSHTPHLGPEVTQQIQTRPPRLTLIHALFARAGLLDHSGDYRAAAACLREAHAIAAQRSRGADSPEGHRLLVDRLIANPEEE